MTVKQLLAEIDSAELTEWLAYYQVEPFGQEWLQTGTIASEFSRALCGKGPKPAQFLPVKPPEVAQTPDQMAAVFRAYARARKAQTDGHNRQS